MLTAPVSGIVISRNAEPGERLAPGQSALTHRGGVRAIRAGLHPDSGAAGRASRASAVAVLDGYPDRPIPGQVVAISPRAEFTPRIALTEEERADLLFGVKVALSDTTGLLRPGLPATVELEREAAAMSEPAWTDAVVANGLRKTFGALVAVEGLTMTVPRGEVFGFLGPNGSGKTTTIRMLCGLMEPSGGSATVVGYDVRRDAEQIRRRIGYMSQKFGLYDDLSVGENLRFYASDLRAPRRGPAGPHRRARGGPRARGARRPARRHAERRLEAAPRARVRHGPPARPCCSSTSRPPESTPPHAGIFWRKIHELAAQGTTILVTTHYMDEAAQCGRLAFLSRGRLIAIGTVPEVLEQFRQPTIEDVFIELQRRDEGAVV